MAKRKSKPQKHLIIDADPIVYRSGFAAESVEYDVVAEDDEGKLYTQHFSPGEGETAYQKMHRWLDEFNYKTVDALKRIEPEEVSHALMIARQSLDAIIDEVKSPDQIHVLLSGPNNFRDKIATFKEYKGNRDPEHKPYHYQAIRDYLTDHWEAVVVTGHEADDEVAIRAHKYRRLGDDYIIASIDKDLLQIPGKHYDYRLKQQVVMSEAEARSVLWQQALSGDTTDNIGGACGIGAVKAKKLVEEWTYWEWDDHDFWEELIKVYTLQANKVTGCYYTAEQAAKAALENMRLVYLQRESNELWVPPGQPAQYLEVGLDD